MSTEPVLIAKIEPEAAATKEGGDEAATTSDTASSGDDRKWFYAKLLGCTLWVAGVTYYFFDFYSSLYHGKWAIEGDKLILFTAAVLFLGGLISGLKGALDFFNLTTSSDGWLLKQRWVRVVSLILFWSITSIGVWFFMKINAVHDERFKKFTKLLGEVRVHHDVIKNATVAHRTAKVKSVGGSPLSSVSSPSVDAALRYIDATLKPVVTRLRQQTAPPLDEEIQFMDQACDLIFDASELCNVIVLIEPQKTAAHLCTTTVRSLYREHLEPPRGSLDRSQGWAALQCKLMMLQPPRAP